MKILPSLQCLSNLLPTTTFRQLQSVVSGMLCVPGRLTQLGISRWTEKGGSYRTIHRFFHTELNWDDLLQRLFQTRHHDPSATHILIADESVVGKAGKATHGIDRFFSSLASKPIPGIAVFTIAMANIDLREAIPISFEQVIRTNEEKAAAKERTNARKKKKETSAPKKNNKVGRPKGSKNKNKADIPLSPELLRISEQLQRVIKAEKGVETVTHIAMDGHFGNQFACKMVRDLGLHLISKLRSDAKLFLEPTAKDKEEHPRLKYGQRLNYANLPLNARVLCEEKDGIRTELFELTCLHMDFTDKLRLAIMVRTNLKTGQSSNVNCCSTDLTLSAINIFDSYTLRFQIEFIFRDAKQYFGLDDFMSIKERSVTNSIGLAFFMVSLSRALLKQIREAYPEAGISDLKSYSRGMRYVSEVMKYLQEKPEGISSAGLSERISRLGLIHKGVMRQNSVVSAL